MPKLTFSGGINELNDIAVPPTEAVSGQNFDLGLGNTKFKPRKPFDILGTAKNTSQIHGIHQLIKRDNTKTTLIAAGNTMYTFDGTTFTSKSTSLNTSSEFYHFDWDLDQTILIVDRNLNNVILEWDGTTLSTLTHAIPSVTDFKAKYGLVASGRAVFGNVKTDSTENPHMVVFSEFENRQVYDTSKRSGDGGFSTGNEAFYLLSPDMKPINGLISFQNLIICSTENGELFKLVGDDSTNYRWEDFYKGSAAIGDNSFVDAGDDIFYMRSGGVIESLRSTDRFGDVGTDDISLPVRDTVVNTTGARIVYDQTNRKILFFFDSKILVLFKDLLRGQSSPFSIYKTLHASAFNVLSPVYMERPDASTNKSVFFGDDNGNLYDLNGTGTSGDSGTEQITTQRKFPLLPFDYKTDLRGRVFYRRLGACSLNLTFDWGDEKSVTDLTIDLKGITGTPDGNYYNAAVYYGGTFYYNEGPSEFSNPVSKGFSAIGKGSSVFVTMDVTTVEDFEVDYIEV